MRIYFHDKHKKYLFICLLEIAFRIKRSIVEYKFNALIKILNLGLNIESINCLLHYLRFANLKRKERKTNVRFSAALVVNRYRFIIIEIFFGFVPRISALYAPKRRPIDRHKNIVNYKL